jgi:hypothetical protein
VRRHGGLTPKELTYVNWFWGPEVGHFEVRYSEPKPYVPPVKKVLPKVSDADLTEAKAKAQGGGAPEWYDLAMALWSRHEMEPAIAAFEKAAAADPEILGRDDWGLMAAAHATLVGPLETGKIDAKQRLLAGRMALIQGDLPMAVDQLIRAASGDQGLRDQVRDYLRSMVAAGRTSFLFQAPEFTSFRQAFIIEKNEPRIYLHASLQPSTPHLMVPLDLTLEPEFVQKLEVVSPDVLLAIPDPNVATGSTRIWLALKHKDEEWPTWGAKTVTLLDPAKADWIELSNYNVNPDMTDNWSTVIAPETVFGMNFSAGSIDKIDQGVRFAAFQLRLTTGKGPWFSIREFSAAPMPREIDVWSIMEKAAAGTL